RSSHLNLGLLPPAFFRPPCPCRGLAASGRTAARRYAPAERRRQGGHGSSAKRTPLTLRRAKPALTLRPCHSKRARWQTGRAARVASRSPRLMARAPALCRDVRLMGRCLVGVEQARDSEIM